MSKKVHIVEGNASFTKMFVARGFEIVPGIDKADFVQFTGGSDVNPSLYGEARHPTTHYNSERDQREARIFDMCVARGIPMAGICRGGQFLNVMCGGAMYQNVDNHALPGTHLTVNLETGGFIACTSTHHQMMRPTDEAEILGVASESTHYEYMQDGRIKYHRPDRGQDVEVVFYPKQKALCFQPHPEYMDPHSVCQGWYFRLIENKLYKEAVCAA